MIGEPVPGRVGMVRPCLVCGTDVYCLPSRLRKSKSGNIFCSRNCATVHNNQFKAGPKHGNWSNGNASYRKRAIAHYGLGCSNPECPITEACIEIPEQMVEVDHIDSDRTNNNIENLQTLCTWCHRLKTLGISTGASVDHI